MCIRQRRTRNREQGSSRKQQEAAGSCGKQQEAAGSGRKRLEREDFMFPRDVVIVAGARTPMARYTGSFSEVSAIELAAIASREAIKRSGADAGEFDHAIFGNVMQTSADALYGARHVGLKAGLKIETPAVTVNRLCGSGIEAISQAAQRLLLGEATMV